MRPPLLVRIVAGVALAVPLTMLGSAAAIAVGASLAAAVMIGGGLGAVGGLLAQRVVETEDKDHE